MKKSYNLRLTQEIINHLQTKDNASEYIRNLIIADSHRETRYEYVWPIVSKYALTNCGKASSEALELIATLAMFLTRQISGEDVLTEIMKGGK